jgi:hypothetical protein
MQQVRQVAMANSHDDDVAQQVSITVLEKLIRFQPKDSLAFGKYVVSITAKHRLKRHFARKLIQPDPDTEETAPEQEQAYVSLATMNLTKPEIVAEIDKRRERRAKRLSADADYVINTIMAVIENSSDPNSELYDPQAVLKGAELIGKTLKLFTDKLEIGGDAVKITNVLLNI